MVISFIYGHFGVFSYTKGIIIAMARVVIHSSIFTLPSLYSWGFFFFFILTGKTPSPYHGSVQLLLAKHSLKKSAFLDNLHLKFSARITSIFNPISQGMTAGCPASRRGQDTAVPKQGSGLAQHHFRKPGAGGCSPPELPYSARPGPAGLI